MRKRLLAALLAGAITATAFAPALAQTTTEEPTEPVKVEDTRPVTYGSVDVLGDYVFRGLDFGQDTVVQGFGGVEFSNGASLNGFVNYDTGTGDVNEVDLIAGYSRDVGRFNLYGDATYFKFPNTDLDDTVELQAKVTANTRLSPHLALVRDVHLTTGNYAELGIEDSFKVRGQPVDWKLNLGYNDEYFTDDSGFSHLELKLGTSFGEGRVKIGTTFQYSEPLRSDFDRHLVAGFNASW